MVLDAGARCSKASTSPRSQQDITLLLVRGESLTQELQEC
jgi:hypothetical protein